jgi:outer membrane protein TolC
MKKTYPPALGRAVRFLIAVCCVVFGTVGLHAEELSLEQALSLALSNNDELNKSKTALEQAKRAAVFSWNAFMPNISASGSISNRHPINPKADPTDSWSASGGITLSLTAAIPVRMKLAVVKQQTEEANYREAERTLTVDVSKSFYQLLADKENISILRDNLELTKSQYEQSRRNYQ